MDTPGRLGEVVLGDGRTVQYWDGGAQEGRVVLLHPGTPSSRLFGLHLHDEAVDAWVRVVSVNRPGYGGSTSTPPGLGSVGRDTWEVADLLGLGEVSLLGISGGGPYALATAALAPSRVRAVGVVAGVGEPRTVEPDTVRADIERFVAPLLALDDEAMVQGFFSSVAAGVSRRGGAAYRALWARDLREALRSYDGFVRDNLSWDDPWDVDPSSVRSRCLLWYGEADAMVPASHGRHLAELVRGSELTVFPGAGHGSVTLDHVPEVLRTLS